MRGAGSDGADQAARRGRRGPRRRVSAPSRTEPARRHRVGRRDRAVEQVPGPHDQGLGVAAGGEERRRRPAGANRSSIASAAISTARSRPPRPAGQLGQAGRTVEHPRVVGRQGEVPGVVTLEAAQPPAVGATQRAKSNSPTRSAASAQRGPPRSRAAASASAEAAMAFHSVSTLSSTAGWGRAPAGREQGHPGRLDRRAGGRAAPRAGGGARWCPPSCPPRSTP